VSRSRNVSTKSGAIQNVRPKKLRWEIFHAPGRLVYAGRRVVVRLLDDWPGADPLLHAYKNIALLSQRHGNPREGSARTRCRPDVSRERFCMVRIDSMNERGPSPMTTSPSRLENNSDNGRGRSIRTLVNDRS
jgi:hypothetical protein